MLNAVVHNWNICRVYCEQTLTLTVRSIVHKQLNLPCFGKASFEISKRLLHYYRTKMQRAVLPPLAPPGKRAGGAAAAPRSGTTVCDITKGIPFAKIVTKKRDYQTIAVRNQ